MCDSWIKSRRLALIAGGKPDTYNRGTMRTQNRPFVVEIKKAKRAEKTGATPVPAAAPLWGAGLETLESATSASAARRAADALFSFKPAAAPQVEAVIADPAPAEESAVAAPARGRVLWAQPVDPAISVDADPADISVPAEVVQPAPPRERRRRVSSRPRAACAEPVPAPEPAALAPVEIDAPAIVLAAGTPEKTSRGQRARRGREDKLALGERWKRRLPKFCR